MRIEGKWILFDDGRRRPMVDVGVKDRHGRWLDVWVLIDLEADQTVFGHDLLLALDLLRQPPESDLGLGGIGGSADYVDVQTSLRLTATSGKRHTFQREFPAFTSPEGGNISLLGRDILDHFDVIVARNQGEIVLLGKGHRSRIESMG